VSDNTLKQIIYIYDDAGNRIKVSGNAQQNIMPKITILVASVTAARVGSSARLTWASTDATHCALAEFGVYTHTNLLTSGVKVLNIRQNTAITLACYNGKNVVTQGKLVRIVQSGGGSRPSNRN
jgi:uncharacterized protein YggE